MNEARNVNDAMGPEAWFKSLPFVTRYWLGATLATTLAGNLSIVPIYHLLFNWTRIQNNIELWRFLTSFLYAGGFSFDTLITCYMLMQFSKQYEGGGPYNTGAGGGTADYIFMLLIGMVTILATYPLVGMLLRLAPIFCRTLVFFVLYVWSKRHPDSQANIWGVPIPGMYLPFAYLALTVFMGNPYSDLLHGLAAGHLYYFLADVVPQVQGRDVLITPQFLIDKFGVGEYRPMAAPVPREPGRNMAAEPQQGGAGGHNWGTGGRPLGR